AAHDKDPHWRLRLDIVGGTLKPTVEPKTPEREEILGEIAVDRCCRAEIDIAGIAERAVAMGPGPEDQAGGAAFVTREPEIVDGRVLGVGQRVVVGPGRLFQIKGAAVANAAAIGVREAAAVEKLCGKARRVETAERGLGMRRIGKAEGTDPAIAPGLPNQPDEG